jgi:fimbrial chaperone protein
MANAEYTISPVKVYISPTDKVTSLTIKNGNDEEASFQLALYKWTRVDGKDVYEESKELTVTPAIFKMQAGDSQVIRLAPKSASKPTVEKAYRLFLKELPTRQATEANTVNVVMQFGVPVFVQPAKKEGALSCNLTGSKDKTLDLSCKNNHNQHTLISSVELFGNDESLAKQDINKYAFPSETVNITIDKPETDAKISANLITYYNGSKIETPLMVQ